MDRSKGTFRQFFGTVYLLIGLIFLIVIGINLLSFFAVRGLGGKFADLNTTARKFETEILQVNLMFREMASGYRDHSPDALWARLNKAAATAAHLKEIDPKANIDTELAEFKRILGENYQHLSGDSEDTADLEKAFDNASELLLRKLAVFVEDLEETIDNRNLTIQILFLILMVILCIGCAISYGILFRYDRISRSLEKRLTGKQRKLQAFVEAIDSVLISLDKDGNIMDFNKKAANFFYKNPSAISGRNLFMLIPELKPYQLQMEAALHSGTRKEKKREKISVDKGRERTVNIYFSPVAGPTGKPSFVILSIDDITSDDMLDEKEILSRKMEVLRNLAAGIRKDLHDVLNSLSPYLSLLKEDPNASQAAEAAESAYKTADALLRRLHAMFPGFRGDDPSARRGKVDIPPLVLDVLNTCRETLPSEIELELSLPEKPLPVHASAEEVEAIVMNLCSNAAEALMSSSGEEAADETKSSQKTIAVSVSEYQANAAFRDEFLVGESTYCLISVRDNGAPIPEENLKKIFEPFFSTKDSTHLGLGLPAVLEQVKDLSGYLRFTSSAREGTVFQVYLPLAE